MRLSSKQSVLARLRRGRAARQQFVESHLNKGMAYQIRATRDRLEWSQERLANEVDMNQNAISRLESPEYGKQTITTLKRLAAAFDVGLIVRFVPFSEMVDWVSCTPRVAEGLTTRALAVPSFEKEESEGAFAERPAHVLARISAGAADSANTQQDRGREPIIAIMVRTAPFPLSATVSNNWSQPQQGVHPSAMRAAEERIIQ
jgi:transcriptional regulator with XRE-family HTH domain